MEKRIYNSTTKGNILISEMKLPHLTNAINKLTAEVSRMDVNSPAYRVKLQQMNWLQDELQKRAESTATPDLSGLYPEEKEVIKRAGEIREMKHNISPDKSHFENCKTSIMGIFDMMAKADPEEYPNLLRSIKFEINKRIDKYAATGKT